MTPSGCRGRRLPSFHYVNPEAPQSHFPLRDNIIVAYVVARDFLKKNFFPLLWSIFPHSFLFPCQSASETRLGASPSIAAGPKPKREARQNLPQRRRFTPL